MSRKRPPPADPPAAGAAASGPGLDDFVRMYEQLRALAVDKAGKLLPPDQADDAVEDASGKLLGMWPTLSPAQQTEAYFLRAVQNRARDARRSEDRRDARKVDLRSVPAHDPYAVMDEEDEEKARTMEEESRSDALHRIAEEMPGRQRDVWLQCRIMGRSPEFAAGLLGMSVKTARNHLQRADDYIRAQLLAGRLEEEIARERAESLERAEREWQRRFGQQVKKQP